uniref:ARAD1C18546p n=1 Tax=Blastobotrys adeninivorans TaxID=409370 RepID=A0A060T6D0_BLAAD
MSFQLHQYGGPPQQQQQQYSYSPTPDMNNANASQASSPYGGPGGPGGQAMGGAQFQPQTQQQMMGGGQQFAARQFRNTYTPGPQGQEAMMMRAAAAQGAQGVKYPGQARAQMAPQFQQQQAQAYQARNFGQPQYQQQLAAQQMAQQVPQQMGAPAAGGAPPAGLFQQQPQQQQQQQQRLQQQIQPVQSPQVANATGSQVSAAPLSAPVPPAGYSSPRKVLQVTGDIEKDKQLMESDPAGAKVTRLIKRDAQYDEILRNKEQRNAEIIRRKQVELEYLNQLRALRHSQPNVVFQEGYQGYGNSWTTVPKPRLIYPHERKRFKRLSKELVMTDDQEDMVANAPEMLVPVRVEFDAENKFRLRDTFTWNLNEKALTVAQFSENLLDDFSIPIQYAPQVAQAITEQINDFHPHVYSSEDPTTVATADLPDRDDDLRILIKLDITIGQHNLVDQFEWDINCPENNPEQFAEVMCNEMCLPGEFVTAIAHTIREQSQMYTKSLFLVGHGFDGRLVEDDDIRKEICPRVLPTDFLRPKAVIKEYTPTLYEIAEAELDRQDKDRERESRRKRRQGRTGRRGGPMLPDLKETIRTFRTPVYNAILPGGIDRNLEILRREARVEEQSEDEADEEMTGFSSSRSRRGRQAAYLAHAAIAGQNKSASASPGPAKAALAGQTFTRPPTANLEQRTRATPANGESFIVRLRVPRLREILANRAY